MKNKDVHHSNARVQTQLTRGLQGLKQGFDILSTSPSICPSLNCLQPRKWWCALLPPPWPGKPPSHSFSCHSKLEAGGEISEEHVCTQAQMHTWGQDNPAAGWGRKWSLHFFPVKEIRALAPSGEIKVALFQETKQSKREQRFWHWSLSGEDAIIDTLLCLDESSLPETKDQFTGWFIRIMLKSSNVPVVWLTLSAFTVVKVRANYAWPPGKADEEAIIPVLDWVHHPVGTHDQIILINSLVSARTERGVHFL